MLALTKVRNASRPRLLGSVAWLTVVTAITVQVGCGAAAPPTEEVSAETAAPLASVAVMACVCECMLPSGKKGSEDPQGTDYLFDMENVSEADCPTLNGNPRTGTKAKECWGYGPGTTLRQKGHLVGCSWDAVPSKSET